MEEPQYVAETLAWCNEKRAEKSMEPLERLPKGKMGDPESCPCGEATGLSVYASFFEDEVNGTSGRTPQAVEDFVCAFDAGRLPQYEELPE